MEGDEQLKKPALNATILVLALSVAALIWVWGAHINRSISDYYAHDRATVELLAAIRYGRAISPGILRDAPESFIAAARRLNASEESPSMLQKANRLDGEGLEATWLKDNRELTLRCRYKRNAGYFYVAHTATPDS